MMAKEHNDELVFDISFYQKHQYKYVGHREYQLNKFKCDAKIMTELPTIIKFLESFFVNRLLRRIKGELAFSIGRFHFVKEKKRTYMPSVPYKPGKINYYDGYWQSESYFEKCKNELTELLQPNYLVPKEVEQFVNLVKETDNSVSVHVRKGDFRGKIGYEVEADYYDKAILYMKEALDQPRFFVFSDDINWTKDHIDFGDNAVFADFRCDNGSICDLLAMSKCQHGIMSASTFSWWGNWNKKGIVIAPGGEYCNNRFLGDKCIRI